MDVLSHVLGIPKIGGGGGVAAPVNTVAPAISGTAQVGETLALSLGTWENVTALAAELRYVSDDTVVDTFTADDTYVIQPADAGEQLYLHVVPDGKTAYAVDSEATATIPHTYESRMLAHRADGILPLWLRFRESSGTTFVNSGGEGVALNGTGDGTLTLAQAGQLGAGESLSYNGTNTRVTIPAAAAILNTWTEVTIAILVKSNNAGESNFGRFYGNLRGVMNYAQYNGSANSIQASVHTSATSAVTTTSEGIGTNWTWLFLTYSDTGDRKIRLYKGVSGAVAELAVTTQTAATGTLSSATLDLHIGNNESQTLTLNALEDEFAVFTKVLSEAEMLQLVNLSGLTTPP